jgi:predicted nuclease of restriction endonuclease-like RecB superfamily
MKKNNNKPRKPKKSKQTHSAKRFKSGLERDFAELLVKHGVSAEYEATRFEFIRVGHYTPDWKVSDSLYIETKGYFSPRNRGDLLSFREQHPNVEIFLVFSAPNNRLTSKSKTTYAEWADRHGFRWSSIRQFPIQLFNKRK